MIVDTLMIILVYDTWLYDGKKKSYSMSETGKNSATQGEVRQNKVRPQWVNVHNVSLFCMELECGFQYLLRHSF